MKYLVLSIFFVVVRGQYVYQKPHSQLSSSSSSSFGSQSRDENYIGLQSSSSGSASYQSQANLATSTSGLATSSSQLEPIIKKHYYVHVAPDEPEEAVAAVSHRQVQPEKHYQIIFIKVPSPPQAKQVVVNQQPNIEEKTLVYVLSQAPQAPKQVEIPVPEAKKPTKPEVYFVKYKDQKKIGSANGIQQASLLGGGSIDENQINSDLVAAGGLPDASNSQYSQTSSGDSSSSTSYSQYDSASANGPLLNTFGTSSSSNAGFQAYGIPDQSGPY